MAVIQTLGLYGAMRPATAARLVADFEAERDDCIARGVAWAFPRHWIEEIDAWYTRTLGEDDWQEIRDAARVERRRKKRRAVKKDVDGCTCGSILEL